MRSHGAHLPPLFQHPPRTWWCLRTCTGVGSHDNCCTAWFRHWATDAVIIILGLTGFFGLLGILGDVILGASVCENQPDSWNAAAQRTSAFCLREAVFQHVLQGQAGHRTFLHVFNLNMDSNNISSRVAEQGPNMVQVSSFIQDFINCSSLLRVCMYM